MVRTYTARLLAFVSIHISARSQIKPSFTHCAGGAVNDDMPVVEKRQDNLDKGNADTSLSLRVLNVQKMISIRFHYGLDYNSRLRLQQIKKKEKNRESNSGQITNLPG